MTRVGTFLEYLSPTYWLLSYSISLWLSFSNYDYSDIQRHSIPAKAKVFPDSYLHISDEVSIVYLTSSIIFLQITSSSEHNLYSDKMSGMDHTGDESPWSWLRDVQTCGTILASAYMLYCLTAMWLQLQIKERSLKYRL